MSNLAPNETKAGPAARLPDDLMMMALAFLSLTDALRFVFDLTKARRGRPVAPALWRAVRPRTRLALGAVFDRAPVRWVAPLVDMYGLDAGWGRRALAAACDPPQGSCPVAPLASRAEKALWAMERFGLDAGRRLAPLLAELWRAGRHPLARALVERAGARGRRAVLVATWSAEDPCSLVAAAASGDLGAVRWVWELLGEETLLYNAPRQPIGNALQGALCEACRGGHLDVARWFADRPELPDRAGQAAMIVAASAGRLDIAKWAVTRFGLSDSRCLSVLTDACAGGHTAVIDWLVARFKPTGHDLRDALYAACAAGHYALGERLVRRFGPTCWANVDSVFHKTVESGDLARVRWAAQLLGRRRLRDEAPRAVVAACRAGNQPVAAWLAPAVARWDDTPTLFTEVCRSGHLDVARWLARSYPRAFLPRRRHHSGGRSFDALSWAVAAGRLEVARWLHVYSGGMMLDPDTADRAIRDVCAEGRRDVLEWALATFDLVPTAGWVATAGKHPELVEWLGARVPAMQTELDHDRTFKWMCRDGSLAAARWFAGACPASACRAAGGAALDASDYGHFDVVRWLVERFACELPPTFPETVCRCGALPFAEWMTDVCNVPLPDNAMGLAYDGPHVRLVEWLAARGIPDFPPDDVNSDVGNSSDENDDNLEESDEDNEGDASDAASEDEVEAAQDIEAQNAEFDEFLEEIYSDAT